MFTKFQQDEKAKLPIVIEGCDINLVDYEIESSEISDVENNVQKSQEGVVVLSRKRYQKKVDEIVDDILTNKTVFAKRYFDNLENNMVSEIVQRKSTKRKIETVEHFPVKICKLENYNRRKNKVPMKIIENKVCESAGREPDKVPQVRSAETFDNVKSDEVVLENADSALHTDDSAFQSGEKFDFNLPQVCLLCQRQFSGPAALTAHIFEVHELDFNQVMMESGCLSEKKKKIPNLLKISDVRRSNSFDDTQDNASKSPSYINKISSMEISCHMCTQIFPNKRDLYSHCRTEHTDEFSLICGICCQPNTSLMNLKNHLRICAIEYPVNDRYFCSICKYSEDGMRSMENHVLAHDFLLEMCKREMRMFDPADYVELNSSCEFGPLSPTSKNLSCNLCFQSNFQSFKDFSEHRRKQHSKFHCDLCNKFYGRNSHLWKHVNRLHKNHPSVTCQLCHKTSASKYHLAQHFAKIHSASSVKQRNNNNKNASLRLRRRGREEDDTVELLRPSSFFDFRKSAATSSEDDNNVVVVKSGNDNIVEGIVDTPKAIDASSDLYNNIITNYTPPPNKGDFKCPKCAKCFSMKMLLKKHKKNCRPKSQKDLLTRCKTCARIFKDRKSLAKHLVNYHSEYACEICSEKTQSKCEIVSHIRFSHPNCSLFCNVCGNILRSKNDLEDHLRDHQDSYVCQFCGDPLQSKIKLKMHILSLHRKILSLSCGICLKLFENQHILRDHVQLTHKNELRPFTSCTVCGKNYGSKWKTYDHLNKSHGRIFRACKACLDVFDSEKELNEHCEENHNGKNCGVATAAPKTSSRVKMNENSDELLLLEESDGDEEDVVVGGGNEEMLSLFNNFANEMSGFSKMSLLEKRLTGTKTPVSSDDNNSRQKITNDESMILDNKPSSSTRSVVNNNNINKRYVGEEPEIVVPQGGGSSKRTVYVNSDEPSLCEICFKTWPAKKHLWQHYIRCHKSVAATVCGICLKTNVDYKTLQIHLRLNHPTLLHGQGYGSNFICRICGRYHNASSKLKLHMAIHENFDWNILDKKKNKDDDYYESMIEQVECNTTSVDEEEEEEEEISDDEEDDEDEEYNGNEIKREKDDDIAKKDNDHSCSSSSGMIGEEEEEETTSEGSNMDVRRKKNAASCSSQDEARGKPEQKLTRRSTSEEEEDRPENFSSESDDDNSSTGSCDDDDDDEEEEDSDDDVGEVLEEERDVGSLMTTMMMMREEKSNGTVTSCGELTRTNNGILINDDDDDDNNMTFASENGLFRFKTEELLDSAVKSISIEGEEIIVKEESLNVDYCDLPNIASALNEREIESAVGSIL